MSEHIPVDEQASSADAVEDALRLLGLPGAVAAASYLTAGHAAAYRLLVDVLAREQTHRLTGVGHDELGRLVAAYLDDTVRPDALSDHQLRALMDPQLLQRRMDQLVAWGTCQSWQDHARTEADFLRNRSRYQLTEAGAAINRLVRELDEAGDARTSAAVLAPPILRESLTRTLHDLNTDTTAASAALAQVQTTLADMARTAGRWQSRMAAALGGAPDPDKVTRLLETVVDYVDMWGAGVDLYSVEIAQRARDLEAATDQQWRALAFARMGAEADDAKVGDVVAELRGTVVTLLRWFDGSRSQARILRLQIRDAVAPLLRSHRTLLAVGGVVSRSADLLRLAGALEAAATEDDAWRLWCTATGLFSAQHLGLVSPPIHAPAQTCSWDAPPVPIERRLRAQGGRALTGRAARIVDTSAARARARQAATRERARLAEAEARLVARSGTPLSRWTPLDAVEAEMLLDLVDAARARPADERGRRTGVSADGRRTLRLIPVQERGWAVLYLPAGRLVLADAVAEIHV